MVTAPHRPVQREVLLHHSCAEHERGHGHRDPVVVAREPDHGRGEDSPVGIDHAQVELVPRRGIARGALQHAQLLVLFAEDLVRTPDLLDRSSPGREDERPAGAGHLPQQRVVVHIRGRELVGRKFELLEELDARQIERRGKHRNP